MKRIIVCLDGTWNSADRSSNPTHIVRIRDALASSAGSTRTFQRIYYDEGVGTADPIDRFSGGFLGAGLGLNVRQAYKYLSRHYEPGDEIYLIGFSRGAFTARSVAGFIGACGLLKPDACTSEMEQAAWEYYRTPTKDRPIGDELKLRERCHNELTIKCIAVFDTVGTLGIPNSALNWIGQSRFAFHDTRIGSVVENAFHAVALDEKRTAFKATMWEQPFNPTRPPPRIQQVWFPGVHSDIGGGYPNPELGRIALDWMQGRLAELGVDFEGLKSVDPPGQGLNPHAAIHESRGLPLYLLDRFRPHHRPVRGIAAFDQAQRSTPELVYKPIEEALHRSALDRWVKESRYRPPNLDYVMRVIEGGVLPVVDWDGTVMPADAVSQTFPFVAKTGPWAEMA
jgi:hypothetical protein